MYDLIPLEEAREMLQNSDFWHIYESKRDEVIRDAGSWFKHWQDRGKNPIAVDASGINTSQHEHDTFAASCEAVMERIYGKKE